MKKLVKELEVGDVIKVEFGIDDNVVEVIVDNIEEAKRLDGLEGIDNRFKKLNVHFKDGRETEMYAMADDEVEVI